MILNPPKKRKKLGKFIIIFIGVVLILVLLNLFQQQIKYSFYLISSPLQKFLWGAGDNVSDSFVSVFGANNLKKEIDNLKNENQELRAELAYLKQIKEENQFLREALNIGLEKDFGLILSNVIGKDISQDYILVDKGSDNGVSKNMPVISQQKIILGRISEVYKNFSKVMLISDKKSSFDVKIQDKDILGVIKGEGNFKIIFDLVPRDKEISKGDIIVSTSLGDIFPAGLLVGQVKDYRKSDLDPFQYIEVSPSFNITEIDQLFIINKY